MRIAKRRLGFGCLSLVLALGCSGKRIRLGDGAVEGGGGAGGAAGADAGGEACSRGRVLANEVLWIGDSWVLEPGTQQSTVKELALAAGTIAANEAYPSSAAPGASMATVAQQYDDRERSTPKLKVLLMDGGTWDPIAAEMLGASVADAIDGSITDFEAFLGRVAADATVEHIVYLLVPELPNIPGVADMRPRLQQACSGSSVPCHFVDLQDVWERGDAESYTASNGYLPSAEGGVAIGQAVWATMQASCIAQ